MNVIGVVAPAHTPVMKRIMKQTRRRFPELSRREFSSSNVRKPVVRFVLEQLAASSDCQIVAIIIDKRRTRNYRGDRERLYNAAVLQLMERVWEMHPECRVIMHQRHNKRELRDRLTQQIQQRARSLGIHMPRSRIAHRRARGESGLEVADAVAYALLQHQRGASELYEIIRKLIVVEEPFRGV